MFGWFKKKEVVIVRSQDYYEHLHKRLECIEERLVKLELRHQLKPAGEFKVFQPIVKKPEVKVSKPKKHLSAKDKQDIILAAQNGSKRRDLAERFSVHVTTIGQIINGAKNGQA